MKKKIYFALTTIGLYCLSQATFAADAQYTCPKDTSGVVIPSPNCGPAPTQTPANINWPTTDENPYYAKTGISLYHLRLPGIILPLASQGGSPTPNPGIQFSNVTNNSARINPHFEFGYNLSNPGILPQVFGDHTSVALDFNFLTSSATNSAGPEDEMNLYGLNGTGPINNPIPGAGILGTNTHLKTETSLYNLNLLFKGKVRNDAGDVTYTPYTGLVYSHLKQNNNFNIGFKATPGGDVFFSDNQQDVTTDYIGVGAGTKIAIKLNQNFNIFADGMLQGLYAHSSVNANMQLVDASGAPMPGPFNGGNTQTESVKDHLNKLTYRGILSFGSSYYISGFDDPDSISFNLSVGMEQWGFLPEVVNKSSNTSTFHLGSSSKLSTFTEFGVNLPIA